METNDDDEEYTPFVIDSRIITKSKSPKIPTPQYDDRDVQYKRLPSSSKPNFDPRRLFGRQPEKSAPRSSPPHKQIYTNSGRGDQNPSGNFPYRYPRNQSDRSRYSSYPADDYTYTRFTTPADDVPKEPPRFTGGAQMNEYNQFPPLRDPRARSYDGSKPLTDPHAKGFGGKPQFQPHAKGFGGKPQIEPQAEAMGSNIQQSNHQANATIPQGDPRATVGRGVIPRGDPRATVGSGIIPQGDPRATVGRGIIPQGDPRATVGRGIILQGDPRATVGRGIILQGDPRATVGRGIILQGDPRATVGRGIIPQGDPRATVGRGIILQGDPRATVGRGIIPQGDPRATVGRGIIPQGDARAIVGGYTPQTAPRANVTGSNQLQGAPRANLIYRYKPQGDHRAIFGSNKPQCDPRATSSGNIQQGIPRVNITSGNRPQGDPRGNVIVDTKPQGEPRAVGGTKPQGEPRAVGGAKPKANVIGGKKQKIDSSAKLGKAHQELKAKLLAGTKLHKNLTEREKKLLIEDLANDFQRIMREARESAQPVDSVYTSSTARRTCSEPRMPIAESPNLNPVEPLDKDPNELALVKSVRKEPTLQPQTASSDQKLKDLKYIWQKMPSRANPKPYREQCHVFFDPEFEKWKDLPPEEENLDKPTSQDQRPSYWVDFNKRKEIEPPPVVYNTQETNNKNDLQLKPKWVQPDLKIEEAKEKTREREQIDRSEQQGAKKKRPQAIAAFAAPPRGTIPQLTAASNTVAIYTANNTTAPGNSTHTTSEHKIVHTHTTTVAYISPTPSPEMYSHAQPAVYSPVYPQPYPYAAPAQTSQAYYPHPVPGYTVQYSAHEHSPPPQVYGAYQQVSQSHHYYPQGYTEHHHYVSQQYRANQPGWYYPSQPQQRYPVYVYPGNNNYTQYTRSERMYVQSNRMEVHNSSQSSSSGNCFMRKCPIPTPTTTEEPSSVTITEVEEDTNDNHSQGSSSIVVEDEKEQSSSQDEIEVSSQAGSCESKGSGYTEFQVLYEADSDAIKMEDLNEREWQPFTLPGVKVNYPLQKSPAVANMRDLYTIREEDESSQRSARGSQRSNDSPRVMGQSESSAPRANVVTTSQSVYPPLPRKFNK